ncbi:MAG: hypothetical protein H7Y14_01210, partial [Burkholderiales bacterium]|nr:hypothetical protein [Burkholderiales bacterium]
SGHDQLDSIGAIKGAICSTANSQMMSQADGMQPANPAARDDRGRGRGRDKDKDEKDEEEKKDKDKR